MITDELKPCPFCGGYAHIEGGEEYGFFATCNACFCCVGEAYDKSAMPEHLFVDREGAIAAWNRRTAGPALGAEDRTDLLPFTASAAAEAMLEDSATEEVGKLRDVLAKAVKASEPHPTSDKLREWKELAALAETEIKQGGSVVSPRSVEHSIVARTAVPALCAEVERLREALNAILHDMPIIDCDRLHHAKEDRHGAGPCPVEIRLEKAITLARSALQDE